MFPNGWHYYISVVLNGPAPRKRAAVGGTFGIDPGVSTVAAVSDDRVFLEELAPEIGKYNRQICNLQRHMDISKRQSNPQKYKPDGTINRSNHDRWVFSKTYQKTRQKLKFHEQVAERIANVRFTNINNTKGADISLPSGFIKGK